MFIRYGMLLILAVSGTAHAQQPPAESWGKPDISFSDYRRDAITCATVGYFRDVSQDEPAKTFIRGFQTYDNTLNMPAWGGYSAWLPLGITRDSVLTMQPDRQLKDIQALQVGDVEQCLTQRGYTKFTLSDAQERTLKRYPKGSEARQQFLYRLATAERPR